ncbi:hypothetical protein PVL30_003656 [Lodderomyces elongisporus]|uniref:uncharacterized protein n=1 Tax=Lodderomyces elongisporus TaxID=36914 RepID=UPI00292430F7|nr:uncharacterized protein PVL30_003656 [Lodderomyces elongisporus]WLF79890.1 hypothetical protein PVL30_003656 [Lodderomyces elongisporus]
MSNPENTKPTENKVQPDKPYTHVPTPDRADLRQTLHSNSTIEDEDTSSIGDNVKSIVQELVKPSRADVTLKKPVTIN